MTIIIFDEDVSSGQQFLDVSGDVVGDILKYSGTKHQNPILPLTPMCQVTPCQISYIYDNVCSFSELLYTFTSFRQRNMGFGAPETKRPRVGGVQYELVMAQGIC